MKGTWYSSAHLSCSGGCQHHRQDSSIQSRQNFPFHKGLIEYHIAVCRNPLLHCSKGPYSLSFQYLPCRLFRASILMSLSCPHYQYYQWLLTPPHLLTLSSVCLQCLVLVH